MTEDYCTWGVFDLPLQPDILPLRPRPYLATLLTRQNERLTNISRDESTILRFPLPSPAHIALPPLPPKLDPRPAGLVRVAERTPVYTKRTFTAHDPVQLERVARRTMLRRRHGILVQRDGEDGPEERQRRSRGEGQEGQSHRSVKIRDFWGSVHVCPTAWA